MALTDTHCHLDIEQFDPDRGAVIERAAQAGIARILIPGLNLTSSRAAVDMAASHLMLYAAVGVHPTETLNVERSTFNELHQLAKKPKVKAIGEIGLDYCREATPHGLQKQALGEQLELAAELNLPVVIHLREKNDAENGNAASDLTQILEAWVDRLRGVRSPLAERPGVLHSFSGSLETAQAALRLGFYIGVTGPVTYKNAGRRQEIIASLPLEKLLLETDAPFLAPHPQRGRRNEPAYVQHIADKIAALHTCTPEHVARITSANAQRLFGWE